VADSPTSHPVARYRFRTFGPPALLGAADETFLGQHGHHRRRLALLAVLAASGERGRSRDQLLVLFWPDATQSRARHSLDQLLYALRNSLGETVFDGVNPVRLNPDVVGSDVVAFKSALERGDLEAAVGEYRGPFLDGFYIDDAPEFEQWAEAERARLATSYAAALERLARDADAARDHSTAVRRWRMLAEADPVSSKNATGLIGALLSSGDPAAALQYAKRYEALAVQELGVGARPAVATLIDEVRAHAQAEPSALPSQLVMPRGALQSAPVDSPSPNRSTRRRSRPYMIAALATVVVIAGVVQLRSMTRANRPVAAAEPSIAVLPFENVSGSPEDAALVDGFTEDLTAMLAKLAPLRVNAGAAAFTFTNSNVGARRIGDSLGVGNILEGATQKVGSHLRVQVRLIDTRNGSTRWSQTYDRELRDIVLIQTDIVDAVARALDLHLGARALAAISRTSAPSIAAYELYVRGSDPALTRSDSGARVGLEYFRQAIALDPRYAAAYAGLARLHARIGAGDDEEMPLRDRLALAEQAALKAVALDDSLAEAHATLGIVRRFNLDLASAETELKRAVALEPANARFREALVQLYVLAERDSDALLEGRRAVELEPLSPTANAELAHALLANDRCDEALAQLQKLSSLRPPLLRASSFAAQCYTRKHMWPEAIAALQRTVAHAGPRGDAQLGYVLARAGRRDEARRTLAALLDRSRRIEGGAFEVAVVYVGLGEKDKAFAWLDKAVDDRSLGFEWLPTIADDLRPDPRFDRLRRRIGIQKG